MNSKEKPKLSVQVEDGKKSAGEGSTGNTLERKYESEEEGCVAQPALVTKETVAMAGLIPPEVLLTGDLQEEELEPEPKVDEVSPAEPLSPPEDPSDITDLENCAPEIRLTKDSQVQELEPESIRKPERD